jgi:hypothetical protein
LVESKGPKEEGGREGILLYMLEEVSARWDVSNPTH